MSSGIWLAASGAAAQMVSLDATANNLANVSTPGFRGERAVFREHLIQAAFAGNNQAEMRYVGMAEIGMDQRGGPLTVTGRGLDAALTGPGFFAIQAAEGEHYTRAGAFHIDATGTLRTGDGHAVLGAGGQPVQVPVEEGEVRISEDGGVLVGDEEVGRLRVVQFAEPGRLERAGLQLFRATPQAGTPEAVAATLEVGVVEGANVSVVKGMTDMVSTTRAFEVLERAVEVYSELDRLAASELAGGGR